MDFLRFSRLNNRFAALILVFLVSFSLYGLYCINTVSEVKINGPYYKRIIQGKDVIADILPPPEYLIETYLTAYRMFHADSGEDLGTFEAKFRKLRADYMERHAHWKKELAEDELKRILVVESYEPAQRMLEAVDREFVPAMRAGNLDQARTVLELVIHREYVLHRNAIDKVVALAVKRNQEDEARAAVAVQSRTYGQIALGVFLFFILSVFSSWVIRNGDAKARSGAPPDSAGGKDADRDAANFQPRSKSGNKLTPG